MVKVFAKSGNVNVRVQPSTTARVLMQITSEISVEATGQRIKDNQGFNWHEVKAGAAVGYVREDVALLVPASIKPSYNMIKPMAGPVRSKFGNRIHPVTKQADRFHNGVDIAAPIGRRIVSPADGVVVNLFEHEFGGKTLIIKHSNGLESRMCHLDGWLVKRGDKVLQGQEVAINGNTGRSTGPHLHFGIKNEGNEFIDPETIIQFS
jgi:murein DD-endopeptidase MepM/ murein hydrolase activator NlpD